MRSLKSVALALLLASTAIAHAQTGKTAAAPAATDAKAAEAKLNTVLATVNGEKITERDLSIAYAGLSDAVKQQPQAQVLPQLLNELINAKALEIEARKEGLDKDVDVKAQMEASANAVLQNALLRKDLAPQLTEDKIKAAYDAQYAGKPGEQEIHAEHILVKTQDQAQSIIDQLNKGADFATLAKANSSDSTAAQGGDLGWFKKGDMVQSFADAAFALKPGEYSKTPVQSPYGWHVIKVLDTRAAAPATLDQVHDQLAQQMEQDALKAELTKLRGAAKVVVFDENGKPVDQNAAAKTPAAK
jgi:peptidyl-prolyl cis-trans isomerase C